MINFDSDEYVKTADEWVAIPGALAGIARLTAAGYLLGICSNQSGVGRGLITRSSLANIELKMIGAVQEAGGVIHTILYCEHQPSAGCACRKPKPGMLLSAMTELQAQPEDTLFVGDSFSDIQAAKAARCSAALVRTGNGCQTERNIGPNCAIRVANDLYELSEQLA